MKIIKLFAVLCIIGFSFQLKAQKDKLKSTYFNPNNDVIAVFKSGTVALYSNPDLELITETSPGDKKNNTQSMGMSSSGNYLIVSDNKVKAWIVYDAVTLEEITRIDNSQYGFPRFIGNDIIFRDKKILSFPTLEVIQDLSSHETKHEGYAFSANQKYYLNYEIDGTGGDGEFEVFETETGNSLGNSKLCESATQSKFVINSYSGFIDDSNIKIVYKEFMDMDEVKYEWVVPIQLGEDNFDIKPSQDLFTSSKNGAITIDYDKLLIISGEYAIDPAGDYALYGMNANQVKSPDNNFLLVSTPKNQINLYKNDATSTEKAGDFIKSTLLKSIEIPAEK